MTQETIQIEGKTYINAEQNPIPEWPAVVNEQPQPTLTLKDNDIFLVTDSLGNIAGSLQDDCNSSMGLFCRDTRFLSRLELQIEKRTPVLLSSTADKGFGLTVLCTNPRIENHLSPDTLGIKRELMLNGALFSEIEITNYSTEAVSFQISLSLNADFVDLFEVRGYGRPKRGQLLRNLAIIGDKKPVEELLTVGAGNNEIEKEFANYITPLSQDEELILAYLGLDNKLMESRIRFDHRRPDYLKGYTAIWNMNLQPHQTEIIGYRLQMFINNRPASVINPPVTLTQAKAAESQEEQLWTHESTHIRSDKNTFNEIIERAEEDLYILRQTFGKNTALSAGVPWFSTLFGRDSIIAASQTLMLNPKLARDTLQILAEYQGKKDDEWRDEQPGKILHEIRYGEMARCEEIPHTPYYGTVDATPLWLMLYAEYFAWTNDKELLEELWPNALAAMEWIDRNCQQTGYLSYDRQSKRGLDNQGWKDSGDCIVDRQGKRATGPIALSEVQGYVYAAKIRLAEIARLKKRLDLADRWQEDARNLKQRFNRDFWVEDLDFCALALDGEGKPVDSITSNPGHCLQLGIFELEKAHSVAERLRAPDMFNGWGIRTLSSKSPAYNPMGYHIGSVWPHDNSLIAIGLRSLGLVEQAIEIGEGLLDMTRVQAYKRPPELFCGYERQDNNRPVRYPVACSPQAWATGSIFQLLQMMVNLVPDAPNNCLHIIDPTLPERINKISLSNLKIGNTILDLEFERSGNTTACRVAKKRGNLRVVIEA
ncbi:amylo-alpha-1,6-glucosidase [Ancylothrix sp. C2]|uniref:amylo-alpha-1,6-glucosidase n=1 Tax=Ancylothrix sp. D3o TaxID=2953691 RepID=UPI0021BBA8C3|nr:amylo-alpha-1,6-glucosidase [Ancylothrix sp. D3o]MCT7949591.1 amylo-alpha-1,6-glucosidase [Ancylothrix sp. D3o]